VTQGQPPSVSVVVTALNGEASIGRCLDALATQTLRPLEITVSVRLGRVRQIVANKGRD
jgi:hypothetical protein